MKLTRLVTGALQCNNYLLENGGEAVLIDCGGSGQEAVLAARQAGVSICALLLTHGHADHIEGVDQVAKAFNCPVYLHVLDGEFLNRPDYNLSQRIYQLPLVVKAKVEPVQDGQVIEAAGLKFKVIHTPGHTPGSVCYQCGDVLFTGDTLFRESIGGDFPPFGDLNTEIDSIRSSLFNLGKDYLCYPGHGEETTLFYEMKNNMYCRI